MGQHVERVQMVPMARVATGVLLGYGRLNIAWEIQLEYGRACFYENSHTHELRLFLDHPQGTMACIKSHQILTLQADPDRLAVHLSLRYPPRFLKLNSSNLFNRLLAWHPNHAPVASYSSRDIIVYFSYKEALQHFQRGCVNLLLPPVTHQLLVLGHLDVHMEAAMTKQVQNWMLKQDFEMAYEIERFSQGRALSQRSLLTLLPVLEVVQRSGGWIMLESLLQQIFNSQGTTMLPETVSTHEW